jgi:hypothetical protein
LSVSTAADNFWPGFMLLGQLCDLAREAREFAEPREEVAEPV